MKKNKIMRFASALLVLAMLTTCVISGTFAKYTTNVEGTDTARVAKWGFKEAAANVTLDNLFNKTYDKNVEGKADVIAPGTTNSAQFGFTYDGNGAPEVAYTFKISTTGSECADEIKNNPNIQWKLDNGDWGTWDNLLDAIAALNTKETYAAGELPPAFENATTHTVAWQWAFESAGAGQAAQNTLDTSMGNKATLDDVTLKITVTATQID